MRSLRYLPGIRSSLQALPPQAREDLKSALEALRTKKAARGVDVKRLLGTFQKPLARLKVGAWRIVFYEDGDDVYIVRVFPRKQGYDWLSEWATLAP